MIYETLTYILSFVLLYIALLHWFLKREHYNRQKDRPSWPEYCREYGKTKDRIKLLESRECEMSKKLDKIEADIKKLSENYKENRR